MDIHLPEQEINNFKRFENKVMQRISELAEDLQLDGVTILTYLLTISVKLNDKANINTDLDTIFKTIKEEYYAHKSSNPETIN